MSTISSVSTAASSPVRATGPIRPADADVGSKGTAGAARDGDGDDKGVASVSAAPSSAAATSSTAVQGALMTLRKGG